MALSDPKPVIAVSEPEKSADKTPQVMKPMIAVVSFAKKLSIFVVRLYFRRLRLKFPGVALAFLWPKVRMRLMH